MDNITHNSIVAISVDKSCNGYPEIPPFGPSEIYPEFDKFVRCSQNSNTVYPLFRDLLKEMGLDRDNFNKPEWNPFGEFISPGNKVLIKPNFVKHVNSGPGDLFSMITHGSVIRCALEYAALALKGEGEIIVGDAPVQSADFSQILKKTNLIEICEYVEKTWNILVKIIDFRLSTISLDSNHRIISERQVQGDRTGYHEVDLAPSSMLGPLDNHCDRYRVTNYDCQTMVKHHNEKKHEYLIPNIVLQADVVINLPKLKTHRKVGLTASLKNLVGINGHKDWLPHHRVGAKCEGGDEYNHRSILKKFKGNLVEDIDKKPFDKLNFLRYAIVRGIERILRYVAKDTFEEGSWYGNDTIWRTVIDLNRLLIYADKKGRLAESPQRKLLTVVDAIVAGEGEGPLEPVNRNCGILVGGVNPVAVDTVLSLLVGFDYKKIPLIKNGFNLEKWPIANFSCEELDIRFKSRKWNTVSINSVVPPFNFIPPSGWRKHIEKCL